MIKNILVTGGCGFIASNFLNYMIEKYPEINFVNIDALYYCANINNITKKNRNKNNYKFIKGNIQNKEFIDYILKTNNIDTIIHFAAQSHVDNSFSNPIQYTKDNILGTHNLLESVREYGKINKFIHVSTDEVYGETILDSDIKNENSILNPTNPYSATKASAEMLVNSYRYSYNLPIPLIKKNKFDMSFSGIKTAVSLLSKKEIIDDTFIQNICASFQLCVSRILISKLDYLLKDLKKKSTYVSSVSIVGGVANNKYIFNKISKFTKEQNIGLLLPIKEMMSDNAAMIAWSCISKHKMNENIFFKPDPRMLIT